MLVASILAVLVMLCAGSIGEVPGDGAAEVQALRKLRGNPAAALDTAALAVALLRTFAGNAAMINEAALSLFTIANRSDGGIAACLAVSAPAALVATAGRWAVKSNSEAAIWAMGREPMKGNTSFSSLAMTLLECEIAQPDWCLTNHSRATISNELAALSTCAAFAA
jgi:hypothetical protein